MSVHLATYAVAETREKIPGPPKFTVHVCSNIVLDQMRSTFPFLASISLLGEPPATATEFVYIPCLDSQWQIQGSQQRPVFSPTPHLHCVLRSPHQRILDANANLPSMVLILPTSLNFGNNVFKTGFSSHRVSVKVSPHSTVVFLAISASHVSRRSHIYERSASERRHHKHWRTIEANAGAEEMEDRVSRR